MSGDPRVTLMRAGVADDRLEGLVCAARFEAVRRRQAIAPVAALLAEPDARSEQLDQVLFGEVFDQLRLSGGFALGQAQRDGYVGWVAADALSDQLTTPTHWVKALRAFAFEEASIRSPSRGPLSLNTMVSVVEVTEALARAEGLGWIAKAHLAPVGFVCADPAGVAEAHLGAPYLWGGRDSTGLDCSGLVQQALFACGLACPRDADQQQALGAPAPPDALRRGDLVFWPDHVGMMVDEVRMVHANAHHMAVAIELLTEVQARIGARGSGEPTAYRRLNL